MTPFTEEVLHILRQVPAGRVTSYGRVAALAGSPRGARQVVRILHSMAGPYGLPWHRVVTASGRIADMDEPGRALQTSLLEAEGVTVIGGRVSMEEYGWPE